jgi:hypothetical protein
MLLGADVEHGDQTPIWRLMRRARNSEAAREAKASTTAIAVSLSAPVSPSGVWVRL